MTYKRQERTLPDGRVVSAQRYSQLKPENREAHLARRRKYELTDKRREAKRINWHKNKHNYGYKNETE